MKHFFKVLACLTFFLAGLSGYSQDLIIQRDGTKIRCKILDEDSVSVYYSLGNQRTLYTIKRADIGEYYISATSATMPVPPPIIPVKKEVALLSLSGGVAIPIGDFGSSNIANSRAGLARQGYFIEGALVIKFSKYVGVVASYLYQSNALNEDAFKNGLAKTIPATTFSLNSSPWVCKGFFGGIYLNTPFGISKNASIEAEIMAGDPRFKSIGFDVYYNNQVIEQSQPIDANTLALYMGAGIRYKLSDLISFRLHANYLQANPIFRNGTLTSPNASVRLADFSQRISVVNITAGFVFVL